MTATIIPTLRYHDVAKAIDFLCLAFGFEKKAVYDDSNGRIIHAELTNGNGMIMLGSTEFERPFSRYMIHPDDTEGRQTMTAYIVVKDIDRHFEKASQAGADIVIPLSEQSYGGKDYSCRDPEGYIWSFGSYNPWS